MGKDILPRFNRKGRKVDISPENDRAAEQQHQKKTKFSLSGII